MTTAQHAFEIVAGDEDAPLGATATPDGVHFGVFSEHAEMITVELFDDWDAPIATLDLPQRTGAIRHGFVPGLQPNARYGFRASGPDNRDAGHRFAPSKLLIDPYARALTGQAHVQRCHFDTNTEDSAPHTPKCLVAAPDAHSFDWDGDQPPGTPRDQTIVYEAHVKGLTMLHPDIPEHLRGTYEALAHPSVISHLVRLGVTAIELLPVHGFVNEPFLTKKKLTNYWGYNSLTFFSPDTRYFGPQGADGLKLAIKALHAAGIEVWLDVVYNHTAEGNEHGPTLSFKGLDNATYYVNDAESGFAYANDTGCGNTVNASHPMVTRLVLDSLRYWVETFHVDGFRFDLAPALGRDNRTFAADGRFMSALMQDPVLSTVKLVAEPWDIGLGGYVLGGFPAAFSEWNDRYRDDTRRFWRGDSLATKDLAERLLGSADIFDPNNRPTWSSVNFITSHDGFSLRDLVSYEKKHNRENKEENRDGHNENISTHSGVEGETANPAIRTMRMARARSMLATLFFSQGMPMLLAGDELWNTQGGNNNAYCQDNPIGWIDWEAADPQLIEFVARLIALRKKFPALRQPGYLHGELAGPDDVPNVSWRAFDGGKPDWDAPELDSIALIIACSNSVRQAAPSRADVRVLLALNAGGEARTLKLPALPAVNNWQRMIDTADPCGPEAAVDNEREICAARSVRLYCEHAPGDGEANRD